jgi:hypothetical protein
LHIWSAERLHDQQCPLAHTEARTVTTFDPLSAHPAHQPASRRQKGLAPCGTSQVLWQVITLIFKAFQHVVFELLLIIERLLGHYGFECLRGYLEDRRSHHESAYHDHEYLAI